MTDGTTAPPGEDLLASAVASHRAGNLAAAAVLYRQVLALRPDDPDVLFLAGSVSHGMGRAEEALALLEAAVRARPGFAAALNNIGAVLRARGRDVEAAARFHEAVAADGDFIPARRNLGDALVALGQRTAAIAAYRAAIAIAPDSAETHNNLGMTLRAEGDVENALGHLRRALDLAPGYAVARYNLCTVLLEHGRPEAVPRYCDDRHLGTRMSGGLLACRAVAAGETGDAATVGQLLDLDRLVQVERLATPPGFADGAAFNAALADFVTRHPTLLWEPDYQSTRHGSVTRDLLSGDKGPVAGLEVLVRAAAERYIATLAATMPGHPQMASRPSALQLAAWAVVMGRSGHQAPHIHPAGWLSSVYYVTLPAAMRDGSADPQGWIEFGRPPEAFNCRATYPTRLIRPEEGLFVLFPSYVYHRTLPYDADQPRISIAFDFEPAASPAG